MLLLSVASSNLYAQCCAAGTPNTDNSLANGTGKNVLALSIASQYSYSDQYFRGNQKYESNYLKDSYFHFGSFRASYGISDRIKMVLDLGYFFSKAQTLERNNYFRESKGLADVGISAVYRASISKNLQISPIARITLPFGQFDQKYGPVILPIDLQPSAGSLKSSAGLFASYKIREDWFVSMLGTYEISQKIETEYTSYKYGGLTNARFMTDYYLNDNISAGIQAWYQLREKAQDENEELLNATGGQVLFLCPTLSYSYKTWMLATRYERPVYKNMNGTQLTNKHRFALRLTRSIDLNKNKIVDSLTLEVSGVCGMCKSRIETTALANPNVVFAEWNIDTKLLNIKVLSSLTKSN